MSRSVYLTAVNGTRPLTEWLLPGVAAGAHTEFSLDLVAEEAHTGPVLYCEAAGWVEITQDGGLTWDPVGASISAGIDLGPVSAGSRTTLRLRINHAAGDVRRRAGIELRLGLGV